MKYMGDANWWDVRFNDRPLKLIGHEKILEDDINLFAEGASVLDVACGDGRNAIYLAKMGYNVTAIDFSECALKRLCYFSNREKLSIRCQKTDIDKEGLAGIKEHYDVVLINHYRLNPNGYSEMQALLKENGLVWINGFYELPVNNPNISANDLILESDFEQLTRCNLVDKKIYTANGNKFIRVIYRVV